MKFDILGQYKNSGRGAEDTSLVVFDQRLQSPFNILDRRTPIIRRANLSEVTLQCAIVVRFWLMVELN